eukprot:2915856-Pleurochrysis_carterae.AAC.1
MRACARACPPSRVAPAVNKQRDLEMRTRADIGTGTPKYPPTHTLTRKHTYDHTPRRSASSRIQSWDSSEALYLVMEATAKLACRLPRARVCSVCSGDTK